jgi:hypothetical protein
MLVKMGGKAKVRRRNAYGEIEAIPSIITEDIVIPGLLTIIIQQLFNYDFWFYEIIVPFVGNPTEFTLAFLIEIADRFIDIQETLISNYSVPLATMIAFDDEMVRQIYEHFRRQAIKNT